MIVHSREEWKRELTKGEFMKELGVLGVLGKERPITPNELMNEFTCAFYHDGDSFRWLELRQTAE
jgi:hypothetical protein